MDRNANEMKARAPSGSVAKAAGPGRWAIAGFLFVSHLTALLLTMGQGFTRDEGYYFKAGELYSRWFDDIVARTAEGRPLSAFSRKTIDQRFSYNPEHPAFPKLLFGLSWRLFGRMAPPGLTEDEARRLYRAGHKPAPILGILPESVAFRLPGAVAGAALVAAIFLFGAMVFGTRAGLAAAVAFALMPRAWFHSHLACFDIPIALMWFLSMWAFFVSLHRPGRRWVIITGLVYGLALSTKHNSWIIPFAAGLVVLVVWWRDIEITRGRFGLELGLPPIPYSLVLMVPIGGLVAWLLWPRMWFDTLSRLGWYLGMHLHHEYYWAYFFGTLYTKPPFPWYFPWVMTLVTVPLVTLVLAGIGVHRALSDHEIHLPVPGSVHDHDLGRRLGLTFILVNLVVPIAVFSTTRTPIFGGTKHWLPAMPYLALLAGLGFDTVARRLTLERPWAVIAQGLVGLVLALPAVYGLAHTHPNSCCYYNALLGGPSGMGEYRMQREFWGNSSRPLMPWLDSLPDGTRVYFQDTNWDSVLMYKRDGLLKPDIQPARGWPDADYTLFHHHKEFLDSEFDLREKYGDPYPVTGVYLDGVPLLSVYHNRAGWRDR